MSYYIIISATRAENSCAIQLDIVLSTFFLFSPFLSACFQMLPMCLERHIPLYLPFPWLLIYHSLFVPKQILLIFPSYLHILAFSYIFLFICSTNDIRFSCLGNFGDVVFFCLTPSYQLWKYLPTCNRTGNIPSVPVILYIWKLFMAHARCL